MNRARRGYTRIALLAVLTGFSGQGAVAQSTRTVKIVVPLAPGGGADTLTRLLAERMGRTQSAFAIVVENRVGAGSVIGSEAVARAAPDGNTLLINTPNLVIAAHVHKLSYHPLTSFDPVCRLVSSPTVVAVNSASPYRTLADLVNAARSHPGELTLASVGPATTLHVAAEKLKHDAGVDMIYVPFAGTGPAVNALLGNHIASIVSEYPAVSEQIKAGSVRALATGSAKRIDALPDVPTVAESGYPGFGVDVWWGAFAPAHTPKPMLAEFIDQFAQAVRSPDVMAKLGPLGFYPDVLCGDAFAAYLATQYDDYGRVIRDAHLNAE